MLYDLVSLSKSKHLNKASGFPLSFVVLRALPQKRRLFFLVVRHGTDITLRGTAFGLVGPPPPSSMHNLILFLILVDHPFDHQAVSFWAEGSRRKKRGGRRWSAGESAVSRDHPHPATRFWDFAKCLVCIIWALLGARQAGRVRPESNRY